MKFEIELPDEVFVDESGNRYEPTGEFRGPKANEAHLKAVSGKLVVHRTNFTTAFPRIILRPVWVWPSWLKGWGFAMDQSGELYWYEAEPTRGETYWSTQRTNRRSINISSEEAIPLMVSGLPTITDWTKPVVNPNYKKESIDVDD